MLGGGFVWSQVIGTFCGVVSTMNPKQTNFRLTMSAVNGFMSQTPLPEGLPQRVRDYFHRTKHFYTTESNQSVLLKLSPSLQVGSPLPAIHDAPIPHEL